ncbi:MAG TPA: site-2 protease family protein [Candidatus Binataceae bacterium]|nr:site-2 protease family protein [Candidatus Binataceae bacterium]
MDESSVYKNISPVVTDFPRYQAAAAPAREYRPERLPFRIPAINLVLFFLTLLTTTMAGADAAGAPVAFGLPLSDNLFNLTAGFSFSIPLMLILFAHEMGHYTFARRYGVDTSLPYFIPAPFPSLFFVGTFGAFIRMRAPARTRRAMFDIGAAGPWAGFVVAMAAVVIGLRLSAVSPLDNSAGGLQLGNSLIFWTVSRVVLGVNPNNVNIDLNPIAFAGWLGLFVTTLNLLPIGQLDGGHVVYSLLGGRWHRVISRLFAAGCLLMVLIPWALHQPVWYGWGLWFVLVLFLGLGHPSTLDTDTPLAGSRRLTAWATVVLFILTFSPVPISFVPPQNQPLPPAGQSYNVAQQVPRSSYRSANHFGIHI